MKLVVRSRGLEVGAGSSMEGRRRVAKLELEGSAVHGPGAEGRRVVERLVVATEHVSSSRDSD